MTTDDLALARATGVLRGDPALCHTCVHLVAQHSNGRHCTVRGCGCLSARRPGRLARLWSRLVGDEPPGALPSLLDELDGRGR